MVIFEGCDVVGKGGVIKIIIEKFNLWVCCVVVFLVFIEKEKI